VSSDRQPASGIRFRRLERVDLARVGDIDRTEQIDLLYVQHDTELEAVSGDFSARAWFTDRDGEHSVGAQRRTCEHYLDAGGTALGAFDGERLVGIGIVVPHVRPGIAQLAYLHVSDGYRGRGIGVRLNDDLEHIAREAGATGLVVSATPSENTVRFYLGRGFEPDAEPLPELLELEPEDVHLRKWL
jgi:ribosomal protein S18 acetylase RimI-like enzyme